MCGRSRVVLRGGVLQKSCGAGSDSAGARSKTEAESEKEIRNFGNWKKRENTCPGSFTPVLLQGQEGNIIIECMRWGLAPSYLKSKNDDDPFRMFNARSESVALKQVFSRLLGSKRCVVIIDGFFEWQKLSNGKKQPHYINQDDEKPMALAGLFDEWRTPDGEILRSYTMLTMDAHKDISSWLHHRMPVVLDAKSMPLWLDCKGVDTEIALQTVRKRGKEPNLRTRPVTYKINKTSYQGKDCSTHVNKLKSSIGSFFSKSPGPLQKLEAKVVVKQEAVPTAKLETNVPVKHEGQLPLPVHSSPNHIKEEAEAKKTKKTGAKRQREVQHVRESAKSSAKKTRMAPVKKEKNLLSFFKAKKK